jgi:hypothetical protein
MITRSMNPKPITSAADGEHVAAVFPRSAEDLAVAWHRRLNLFTGRALTAPALGLEQVGRAGRFALRGQVLSPGVVSGLEAVLDPTVVTVRVGDTDRQITQYYLNISQGLGIAASGEDVVVSTPVRVNIGDIEVVAPASLAMDGAPPVVPADGTPADGTLAEPPEARRVFEPLRNLLRRNAQLPPAAVLVLQPVVFESVASGDTSDDCGFGSTNPCEVDASAFAFEDWQLVDGARLLLYAWPEDWLALPAVDDRWRNRLAWSVFGAERGRSADLPMPWEAYGVPLALIGFNTTVAPDREIQWDAGEISWTPLFADRNAVARLGGRPKRRSATPGAEDNAFLWQARVQQLAEQVAGLPSGTTPAQIAAQLRYLPPVGLLPKGATDARAGHDHFFPSNYVVSAAPIPLEQIDILLDESAALAVYDLFTADEVRVYVPVPQMFYEPDLLQTLTVDPEFQQSIDAFTLRRGRWLERRNELRARASALAVGINGKALEFPSPDPDALEDEEPASDPIDPNDPLLQKPEEAYGTTAVGTTLVADAVTKLKADLRSRTPLREKSSVTLDTLSSSFPFPASSQGRISYDPVAKQLTFVGRMTQQQLTDLISVSDAPAAFRTAAAQLFTISQDDDFSRIDELGVSGFIDYVQQKANAADDTVDLGFLRARTDIYRVRQFMLGTDSATRLSTSPALAEIAQGSSAVATKDELSNFLSRVKVTANANTSATGGAAPASAPSTAPASGAAAAGTASAGTLGLTALASNRFTAGESVSLIGTKPIADVGNLGTIGTIGTIGGGVGTIGGSVGTIGGGKLQTPIEVSTTGLSDALRSQQLNATGSLSALNVPLPTTIDISQQTPIVGKSLEFRNVSVAERLKEPVAPEAKSFTVASKYSVMSDVSSLGINVDDLSLPGFLNANGAEVRHTVADIRSQGLLAQVLNDQHDPDPADGDEAAFFSASIRALENSIATLRLVEGRIQAYRTAAAMATTALSELQRQFGLANTRLAAIGEELAEARSDVAVARALLAEEQARVDGVNARRTQVLADHSPFLVYQRPRISDLIRDVPSRAIVPAATALAPSDFLNENAPVPAELSAMVALLRDAPVRWFSHIPTLLDRLDRIDTLAHTLTVAKQRATVDAAPSVAALAPVSDGTKFGAALAGLYQAQRSVVSTYRAQTAAVDLAAVATQSWANVRTQAVDILSIADLAIAVNGRADVAQRVAQEIDQITRAAAVLLEHFGDVLPAIRLEWATRLSEFDAPANLRNLGSLPRWGEIELLDRRTMQGIVDWMFSRIDVTQTDAVAMMNAIVRVCILLASHAPVDRIIAGSVHKDTPLRPGIRIDLVVNLAQVRVGMFVNLYSGANVVARGVVEDLASGLASARVTDSVASVTNLAAGARAQLVEPERATVQGLGVKLAETAATEVNGEGVRAPSGSLPTSLFGAVARAFA